MERADEGEGAEAKPPSSPASEDSILEGLPDEIQDMLKVSLTCSLSCPTASHYWQSHTLYCYSPLQIMKEAFQCSLSVLRALYEAAGNDVNQFIMSSEQ